jgi:hypothetical protein
MTANTRISAFGVQMSPESPENHTFQLHDLSALPNDHTNADTIHYSILNEKDIIPSEMLAEQSKTL